MELIETKVLNFSDGDEISIDVYWDKDLKIYKLYHHNSTEQLVITIDDEQLEDLTIDDLIDFYSFCDETLEVVEDDGIEFTINFSNN